MPVVFVTHQKLETSGLLPQRAAPLGVFTTRRLVGEGQVGPRHGRLAAGARPQRRAGVSHSKLVVGRHTPEHGPDPARCLAQRVLTA